MQTFFFFFYKVVQRGGKNRAVFSGDISHLAPITDPWRWRNKAHEGLASASRWLLLSDAELGDSQRNMPAATQPQPPARAGQLVVAEDTARTGLTRDQSCWHTASHFWQPLTRLRLRKQIWPKVFPFNSSASGFWWIKKTHGTKLLLVLSGLIKCFITFL